MRRILTYLLSSVALPLQLLAVAYSTDRCSLPLSSSASGDSPVAVNPAANVAFTISWTRDGHLREFNQVGGPQCSNSVIRSGSSIVAALESFGGPKITATTVTNFLNADGRLREIAVEVDGFYAMDFRSFAGYDSLGQLTSVTGQYFNVTFASLDGGRVTNTLVSVTNTVNLERNVIWSANGKPARIDYTLNGDFLRRWLYTFQSNRVSRVFRFGGDSLKGNGRFAVTAASGNVRRA